MSFPNIFLEPVNQHQSGLVWLWSPGMAIRCRNAANTQLLVFLWNS
jgi:hypothetical protein